MKITDLKRAQQIESRLLTLKDMRDALQETMPVVAVITPISMSSIMFGRLRAVEGVEHILPKNIKVLCLDAIDTEIAVLTQEMDAL